MANLLAYTSQNPELAKKQELEKEKLKAKAEQVKIVIYNCYVLFTTVIKSF